MASYNFNRKIGGRGTGQSAVAAAAYRSGEKLLDERTGEFKDFTRKDGILSSWIATPDHAPAWMRDRQKLWNAVEHREDKSTRRDKAQLFTNVEMALPHELTLQQQEWLVKDFVKAHYTRKGAVADVAIHAPSREGDERNYHVHIMGTLRKIEDGQFTGKLEQKLATRTLQDKARKDELHALRESWAKHGAKALHRYGFHLEAERFAVGHQSLPEQRAAAIERGDHDHAQSLDREATQHRGVAATQMERRGVATERGAECREIETRNAHRQKELTQTAGDIRLAYTLSDGAQSFQAALTERGIDLAQVSHEEAIESEHARDRAREEGRYAPVYQVGEIVAVNSWGQVYQLTDRTTGSTTGDIEKFLAPLDRSDIHSIEVTQAVNAIQMDFHAASIEVGALPKKEWKHAKARTGGAEGPDIVDGAARAGVKIIGKAIAAAAELTERTIDRVADSLANFLAPPAPTQEQTPERESAPEPKPRVTARVVRQDETTREAKPANDRIDHFRYLADEKYRRDINRRLDDENKRQAEIDRQQDRTRGDDRTRGR